MSRAIGALAVLGIIISAIYGLRAISMIFFGTPSESYAKRLKSGLAPEDMSFAEKAPVLILLGALLCVGFWPRSIGDMINKEVSLKYPAQVVRVEQAVPVADAAATPVTLADERSL
jgi:NADH-quinone oxidoreductase subunit M